MTAYQVVHEAPALERVPGALRALVEPCLAKEPKRRPSADEFLKQLRTLPEDLGQPESRGPRRAGHGYGHPAALRASQGAHEGPRGSRGRPR